MGSVAPFRGWSALVGTSIPFPLIYSEAWRGVRHSFGAPCRGDCLSPCDICDCGIFPPPPTTSGGGRLRGTTDGSKWRLRVTIARDPRVVRATWSTGPGTRGGIAFSAPVIGMKGGFNTSPWRRGVPVVMRVTGPEVPQQLGQTFYVNEMPNVAVVFRYAVTCLSFLSLVSHIGEIMNSFSVFFLSYVYTNPALNIVEAFELCNVLQQYWKLYTFEI